MKCEYYDVAYDNANCVLRSICKITSLNPDVVENDLKMINNDYLNEETFDKYLLSKGFVINQTLKDKFIKDIRLDQYNIVYCYKDNWYHMIAVINNTIYDKHPYDTLKDFKVIKIFSLKK